MTSGIVIDIDRLDRYLVHSQVHITKPEEDIHLIFIPFERDGNKLRAPPEFGNLVPGRIRNTDLDRLIIL